jgi:L-amino acid N-acyltransferase YncA
MTQPFFLIRRASTEDAEGIAKVLDAVAEERIHSAIERAWTAAEQRTYLASLSTREVFHVAITASGQIVGYQSLDLYSPVLSSMAHVGQLGTFLLQEWRGRGVGMALFDATRQFAASTG